MKILAADVGGTYIKFATLNEAAEIFDKDKIDTPRNYEDFLQTIFRIFKAREVEGIAMSLPGIIDAGRGLCITSGALGYNDGKFLVEELEKICGVKVSVENDANCAALAESKIGSLSDVEDGFVMVFGTAVGGAIIKNKKLHRGKNFLAGEVSYMFKCFTNDFSDKKYFGENCSVINLLKEYTQIKNLSDRISGEKFFSAAERGEVDAVNCLKKFTRQIAQQIFNIQIILDTEKFAIGGGISARQIFIDMIRENLESVYNACPINFPRVEVVPCKFRNDANLIGALFSWLNFYN